MSVDRLRHVIEGCLELDRCDTSRDHVGHMGADHVDAENLPVLRFPNHLHESLGLAGGSRPGNVVLPTLIENVPAAAKLSCQEVFGPVLTLSAYDTLNEAIERVNSSEYGIQCGIFTTDLRVAERAFREIQVGGVIVNDYPTLRFDNMPYGGVKRSGFGREGVRYAMEEMTEPKAMLVRTI